MNRFTLFLALLLAFFGVLATQSMLGGGLSRTLADGEDSPGGGAPGAAEKFAFMDVRAVFEKYEKTRDREKEINDEYRAGMEEIRAHKLDLEKKKQEIDLFGPNSPERREREREFALRAFEIQFKEEWLKEQVKDRLRKSTEEIYGEVLARVADFAAKNGFRAVFKIDEEAIDSDSGDELKLKIHTRTVLYHQKGDDVTEAVIAFLNEEYRKGK